MPVTQSSFGSTKDGAAVALFTLTSPAGLTAKITNYGGILTELHAPDKAGNLADIVLGFDKLEQYLARHPFFGATVGRFANRIARGKFTLDGKEYTLPINNGPNSLHGGNRGFDKVVWQAETLANGVKFNYLSRDGEEGFPGNLSATVIFTLEENDLTIDYTATADKPTPVNLTNHSYFNLAGAGNGQILGHEMMINADTFTPVDDTQIPTGKIEAVRDTPMDFTTPHRIGARIGQVKGGYDHNYVLNGAAGKLALAAAARDPSSGRVFVTYTTQPGVQFYTANFLDGSIAGIGGVYGKHAGFCPETQHFPDSVNHANFPSTILRPGQVYHQTTVYRFTTTKPGASL
ncbi:MAG TPA: aldose epimerase family protein [Tepidisphaeraceae bacterium]